MVTGASSGIGAATAQVLAGAGHHVIAVARRAAKLDALAAATAGISPVVADLTTSEGIQAVVTAVGDRPLVALVNVAGGARGGQTLEHSAIEDWRWMFEANVLATQRLTAALLPALRRHAQGRPANRGGAASGLVTASIVTVTSTAGLVAYAGGAGYNAAKFAEHALMGALRLELAGEPIRVIEIAPGMVKTEEFALNRLGSAELAEAVYHNVDHPLSAADVAEAIAAALALPDHVNVDLMVLRPVAQAAQHQLVRGPLRVAGAAHEAE